MPFFLIIPAWIACVVAGVVLTCFETFRRAGGYAICVSTAAMIGSLLLSTALLFIVPRIGLQCSGAWAGVAFLGAYAISIGVGALIGALAGFLVTRRLMRSRSILRA
jgi:hypothetical protein